MLGDSKKGLSLVIGVGKPKKPEMDDMAGDERTAAGKAVAAALKSGDGAQIMDALELALDALKSEPMSAEEPSEDEDL